MRFITTLLPDSGVSPAARYRTALGAALVGLSLSQSGVALADAGSNEDNARINPALTPAPAYPAQALAAQVAGEAKVSCDVTADGRASACKVVSASLPIFADTVLQYALHARYLPALHNGLPVPGHAEIFINFAYPWPKHARTQTEPAIDYMASPPMPLPHLTAQDTGPSSGWAHAQVHCIVDASGHQRECSVTSDWPAFSRSLSQFIATAHFFPSIRDGAPVEAPYVHPFSVNVKQAPDDGFGQ
ncbi:energy transducer TonB [Tanticharoenia sakaeratensis]|uniref:Protein TonB n=1 Tax=Tanticharoenia sakaeratensis NBRC 103193 TaxID=1231623 RepID=A0A0D6MJT6_9PROT|nr:energy transducer TonB [Tanticharoenia sakaeratensis]GAN53730.1 hypothetical protein Tasa_010_277 [Tanticharoenia sakaeratensis NBRC 103193]